MKAYKSLNAFKYFEAGFVNNWGILKIDNFTVILANVSFLYTYSVKLLIHNFQVKHSQRLNDPYLQVWVIANINGSIESVHCTCMTVAGEVCNHVGVLLYAQNI